MNMIEQSKQSTKPSLQSVRFENGLLHLTLRGTAIEGTTVSVPARNIVQLADLSDEELAKVQVASNGHVLLWREANIDFAVAGLIERITGLKTHRAHMAQIGAISSEAKAAAARANGQKGGRPRKNIDSSAPRNPAIE